MDAPHLTLFSLALVSFVGTILGYPARRTATRKHQLIALGLVLTTGSSAFGFSEPVETGIALTGLAAFITALLGRYKPVQEPPSRPI